MLSALLLFLGGFCVCLIVVVFVPLRLSLLAGFRQGDPDPFRIEVRVWGVRVLTFPKKRRGGSSWLGRKLSRWIESILLPKREEDAPEPTGKPVKSRKPLRPGFLIWAAGRGVNLLSRLTRRLEMGCAGIDPALLGTLTGVAAIVQGALGAKRFGWQPDFAPGATRFHVNWKLSISVWKLVSWTGETFVDRNRHSRKP